MIDICFVLLPNPALSNPKMYFPLGVLYLSSSVKKAGFKSMVVDYRDGIKPLPLARFYAFSCTTPEITSAYYYSKLVRGKTVVGGAHPSVMVIQCSQMFDYVICGEGEEAIVDLLVGKIRGGITFTPRIDNLDSLPFPDWDALDSPFSEELFPGERYGKGAKASTIIASRGCPFNCAFCGNLMKTPIMYRSVDNICAEIEELKKRGVTYLRFEDDNFTLHPQFDKLCIQLTTLGIHYKCHTRSDLLTLGKAKWMKESGCEECGLGVESADPEVLKLVNKKETAEQHGRAVLILREVGLRSKTYFIAGLPGETDKTAEYNRQFFVRYKPDKWTLSTFTPYPGCDVYNHPDKYGIKIIQPDWSKWWNFSNHFNHILDGQIEQQMWNRYLNLYEWLRSDIWK